MKYIKKIPPTDKLFCEDLLRSGWKKLKEPANIGIAIIYSLPFAILTFVFEILLIYFLYTPFREMIDGKRAFMIEIQININTLLYVVFIIVFLLIHEFIHACFVPNILNSDKIFWGFNGMFGFVYTKEKIKKYRFLIISVMPYIVLSFVFPIVLNSLGVLNGFMCLLCLINASGSCVDLLNIVLIGMQVPKDSYIVNSGFETYFK